MSAAGWLASSAGAALIDTVFGAAGSSGLVSASVGSVALASVVSVGEALSVGGAFSCFLPSWLVSVSVGSSPLTGIGVVTKCPVDQIIFRN